MTYTKTAPLKISLDIETFGGNNGFEQLLQSLKEDYEDINADIDAINKDIAAVEFAIDNIGVLENPSKDAVAKIKKAKKLLLKFQKDKAVGIDCQVVSVALLPFTDNDAISPESVYVKASPNPAELADFVAHVINDKVNQPYSFVGYNLLAFDLPRLAILLGKHRKNLKYAAGKWDIHDLCLKYKAKLKDVLKAANFPAAPATGADVHRMVIDNEWKKIEEYNAYDVLGTAFLYKITKNVMGV